MRIEVVRIFSKGDADDETMQRIYAKDIVKKRWSIYTELICAYGEWIFNSKFTHLYYESGDDFIVDMTKQELDQIMIEQETIDFSETLSDEE